MHHMYSPTETVSVKMSPTVYLTAGRCLPLRPHRVLQPLYLWRHLFNSPSPSNLAALDRIEQNLITDVNLFPTVQRWRSMAEPQTSLSRANLLMPYVIELVAVIMNQWTIVQFFPAVKMEITAVVMETPPSTIYAVVLIPDHPRRALRPFHAL